MVSEHWSIPWFFFLQPPLSLSISLFFPCHFLFSLSSLSTVEAMDQRWQDNRYLRSRLDISLRSINLLYWENPLSMKIRLNTSWKAYPTITSQWWTKLKAVVSHLLLQKFTRSCSRERQNYLPLSLLFLGINLGKITCHNTHLVSFDTPWYTRLRMLYY